MKPQEIEDLSFKIIEQEAGNHGFDQREWPIVRRMVHTSADFEYIESIRIHPDAIESGIQAIQSGCTIFTDTNMAKVGIRKKEIGAFKGRVECLIADKSVAEKAKADGTTRALAAVDMAAAAESLDKGIYVVGNAPTALLRLIELIQSNEIKPALIVGLPVGFVNAAESKAELIQRNRAIPYITNEGRKGGSNVAASVVNALAIMAAA